MPASASPHRRRSGGPGTRRVFTAPRLLAALLCGLLAVVGLVGQAEAGHGTATRGANAVHALKVHAASAVLSPEAHAASAVHPPKAHAASVFLTGIGDEQSQMFSDPDWQRLHTKIARYIAPYDAAVRPYSLSQASAWIHAAETEHQRVLVAFYQDRKSVV